MALIPSHHCKTMSLWDTRNTSVNLADIGCWISHALNHAFDTWTQINDFRHRLFACPIACKLPNSKRYFSIIPTLFIDVVMRMWRQARYLINRPSNPAGLFSRIAIPAAKSGVQGFLNVSLRHSWSEGKMEIQLLDSSPRHRYPAITDRQRASVSSLEHYCKGKRADLLKSCIDRIWNMRWAVHTYTTILAFSN